MNFHLLATLLVFCLIGGAFAGLDGDGEQTPTTSDDGSSTGEDSADEPAETPEQEAAREAEEQRKRQENYLRFEKFGEEKVKKQNEIDQAWAKKYESVFRGTDSKDPEELLYVLNDLFKTYSDTSNSRDLKYPLQNAIKLVRMTYIFANNCNNEDFPRIDALFKRYSKDYSKSIINFAQFHRSKYLQTCKNVFLDAVNSGDASESEAFAIATHMPYLKRADKPWMVTDLYSIVLGIVDYASEKMGKKAHKDVPVEMFFSGTIKPVCDSVVEKFANKREIVEFVRKQDFMNEELDEKGVKWLTALRVCEIFKQNPNYIQSTSHSILIEKRKKEKKGTCLGCFGRP